MENYITHITQMQSTFGSILHICFFIPRFQHIATMLFNWAIYIYVPLQKRTESPG